MIRILQITPKLDYTGVSMMLLNYYDKIDKKEIIFDFITHGDEEPFHKNLIESGSNIYYFPRPSRLGFCGYYKKLKKIIKKNGIIYNAVHIHLGHLTGIFAFMCKLMGVKRIISHAHATTAPNKKHIPLMPFLRFLSRTFSSLLIACGDKAGKFCFGPRSNYIILNNAIDFEKFKNNNYDNIYRNIFNFSPNKLVVVHIGSFVYLKNHRFILEIISNLKKVKDNFIFIFVGDGPLKEEIMENARLNNLTDYVVFLGVRKDIPDILKAVDLLILPSLYEGMPVVGIEGQASGLNCLFSDTIDRNIDLGIGLANFLPIHNVKIWADFIRNYEKKICNFSICQKGIKDKGYDINTEVIKLTNIYKRLNW